MAIVNIRNRQILAIALPSIVSNITVPLLGLIDVAIVGHMGDAVYIGAVAVGSMIFNLIYWLFAFLRMGTSGMTAQAYGRDNLSSVKAGDERSDGGRSVVIILHRSVCMALGIAAVVLLTQYPLKELMFLLIAPTEDVSPVASTYFYIVVWAAPASLCLFSLNGWFIGMQNTRIPMIISITQNVVNIIASLLLVFGMGMKIEGVALGTVIAQYSGLAAALMLLWYNYHKLLSRYPLAIAQLRMPINFFNINRNIFLRTLCLVAVNLYFTSAGARSGAVILSVNAVLMQYYLLFSYFMDGFANAGEALCGRFLGARDRISFDDTMRHLVGWAIGMTIVFTLLYATFGTTFANVLTDSAEVRMELKDYIYWAWLLPSAGITAFMFDGVFIGITETRGMLLSTMLASLSFFLVYLGLNHFLQTALGNHILWLAFTMFLIVRGLVLVVFFNRKFKLRSVFTNK